MLEEVLILPADEERRDGRIEGEETIMKTE